MEIKAQFCSSLAKIFPDKTPELLPDKITALQGERYSFQLAYMAENNRGSAQIRVTCPLPVTVRKAESVPVRFCGREFDEYIISSTPGLYPDLLTLPDNSGTSFPLRLKQYLAAWFTVEIPADCPPGNYTLDAELAATDYSGENGSWQGRINIEVIGAKLPELSMKYTCWLHGDSLASV